MAVTYSATTKTLRMNAVVTAIGTSGKLEICTAAYATILATFTLNATAGVVSGSVLTLSGFPLAATAGAGGTAALARIRTSANVDVVTGLTVGTSATDIVLDNVAISNGQQVNLSAATITHAA